MTSTDTSAPPPTGSIASGQNPGLDRTHTAELRALEDAYAAARAALPAGRPAPAELREVPWLLEELRVSLFAQPLGSRKVSAKRIRRALAAAT